MTKKEREVVRMKYDNHCAYCGCELGKGFHVDHIKAAWHTWTEDEAKRHKISKGAHSIDNYNPACPRCNRWKGTFSIEDFRREIQAQVLRLNKYVNNYRMAKDYRLIEETNKPVIFYFETLPQD